MGAKLNIIYVYLADVGDFRRYTPLEIIEKKRETDRLFYIYQPYWSIETEDKYDIFMDSAFKTFRGSGERAAIRTESYQKKKAYEVDGIEWDSSWDGYFTEEESLAYEEYYSDLVASFLKDTTSSEVRAILN